MLRILEESNHVILEFPLATIDILFTIKTSVKHKIDMNIHTHMLLMAKPLKEEIQFKKDKKNLTCKI